MLLFIRLGVCDDACSALLAHLRACLLKLLGSGFLPVLRGAALVAISVVVSSVAVEVALPKPVCCMSIV